jgi:hypothetical protein
MSEMKVCKRGGFSDRNKIKPLNQELQIHSLDDHARVAIVNKLHEIYEDIYRFHNYLENCVQVFFRFVYTEVYSSVVQQRNGIFEDDFWQTVDNTILNDDYDDVLTLLEGVVQYWSEAGQHFVNSWGQEYKLNLFKVFNDLFEKEYVGYRFINDSLSVICDETEGQEVSTAMSTPFSSVNEHIKKANLLLSDRQNPDYANSIKESISAVETLCKIVTKARGNDATLGKMIKKMTDCGVNIQPTLSTAFEKLYGYTSTAKGVRHAGDVGGKDVSFEEARFMLVACCAFINYVKGNLAKVNPTVSGLP